MSGLRGLKLQAMWQSLCVALLGFSASFASAEWRMSFKDPVTEIGRQQQSLHWDIMVVITVIFCAVFGVMFYSLFKHRKSIGHKPAQFHEHIGVEIAWTVVPVFILLFMAWPATKAVLAMRDTSASDMTIKVTGYQWKWGYDYIHDGFGYVSKLTTPVSQIDNHGVPGDKKNENYLLEVDNPLVVPMGKKVRLLITAGDVIHAWWVPELGVKQDAVPGFVRDAWFLAEKPGIYRGQCAELCGKEHGFMPIVVEVKPQAEYETWAKDQKKKYGVADKAAAVAAAPAALAASAPAGPMSKDELMKHGQATYAQCGACHGADGKGNEALKAKALAGSAVVTGAKGGLIDVLLNGRAGTAMASFKHLSDTDLAGVLTYARNTWGNSAAEIQPADIAAARGGGAAPVAAAPAAPAAASAGLPAKIYFDSGKTAYGKDSEPAIKAALDFLKAKADNKVSISGYVDGTGDPAKNAELAKLRAFAVRDALKAGGFDEPRVSLKKPEVITGAADNKEARRVEINAAN